MSTHKQFGAVLFSLIMVTSMFVAGISLAGVQPVRADTGDELVPGPVDGPGVIEASGTYYLTADIDLGGANVTAFEIKAGDVVLDGQGHTISNGTSEAIHILAQPSLSNVTVRNLRITGVETAISTMNLQDGAFEDLELVSNHDAGLVFAGNSNTGNVVDGVTFSDNEKGIFLREGTSGMTIRNSVFDANHEVAIKASGSSGNEILDNTFTNQDGEKVIHLTGRSPDNVVAGNTIENSTGPEYVVQVGGESTGTVIENNVIAHNALGGISAGPYNVTMRDNIVFDNGDVGILVGEGDSTVEGNLVYDNRVGLALDATTGVDATDNVVRDNREDDLLALDGATNNDVTGLVVDRVGTLVDVGPASVDYALEGGVNESDLPGDYVFVGEGVDVGFTSDAGRLALTMYYDGSAVTGTLEDQLTLARYDAATSAWVVLGTAPDMGADSLTATIEEPGIVAPVSGTSDINPPTAVATADPTIASVGEDVTFDASNSTDNEGIVSYAWDFGDGTNASGETVTHDYTAGGVYAVTLTVTDTAGYTDTATVEVAVDAADPVAEAGEDVYVQPGVAAEFDGSASTDDVGIAGYAWAFGDGASATGEAVTHAYDDPGTYAVNLTVTDYVGNTATDNLTATVDGEQPQPDAGARNRYGRVDEVLSFDASASTDDVGIASYAWEFGDGAGDTGVTASHAYDAAGTYTVTLTVADLAGNAASTTVEVSVEAAPEPPDDDPSPPPVYDGPSASPSGGSGSSGGAPTTPSGPEVNVTYSNGSQAQVSVRNAGENSTVAVQFRFEEGEACGSLEQLRFRSQTAEQFQLRVNQTAEAPDGTPAWHTRAGEPAFGYIGVDHDARLGDGEFTFRVRTPCLEDAGVDAEHLRLYRYHDGEWVQLETRLLERTESHLRYQADAPGFSVFAIGVAEADISVTDASIEPATVATGERVTVTVSLANAGEVDGTYALELAGDGEVLRTTEVAVPAGETTTATVTHRFDTAGEYAITVDGVAAGTLVVESAAGTPAETPTLGPDDGEPAADEPGGGPAPLTWLFLLLVGAAVVAAFYVLLREEGGLR